MVITVKGMELREGGLAQGTDLVLTFFFVIHSAYLATRSSSMCFVNRYEQLYPT